MENQWNISAIIDRYRLPIDHHDFNLALPNYRNERSPRQWWWMVYSFCTDSDSRAISGTKPLMIQIKHTIMNIFSSILILNILIFFRIYQVVTLPFCPESPKFLLLDKDDEERATSALNWLRGSVDVHSEMDEMRAEQEKMKLIPHISFKEMFTNGALRSPLFIALMMMLAQQLSGINAVRSFWKF